MGITQEEVDLREEVFNYIPGMVNTNSGVAVYHSPDQPFQFQKRVQFGDRSHWPDLESDTAGIQQVTFHHFHQCLSVDQVRYR